MEDTEDHPCIDCGEPDAGCPDGRCRDCDIEYVCARGSCRSCLRWMIREEYGGPIALQHAPGCPLIGVAEYYPRTPEEIATDRKSTRLNSSH